MREIAAPINATTIAVTRNISFLLEISLPICPLIYYLLHADNITIRFGILYHAHFCS